MPSLQLPPDVSSPEAARRFVKRVLSELGESGETTERAVLLANELVTNAVVHTRSRITLEVEVTASQVAIAVADRGPGLIRLRQPTPSDTTGRGLQLLDRLADSWTVDYGAGGKRISFVIASRKAAPSGAGHHEACTPR